MSGCECKPDAKRKRDSAQPEAKGAAINKTVGPTLIDRVTPFARFARGRGALTPNFFAEPPESASQMVGKSDNADPVRFI
jgi:hypothetical protein